MDAEYGRLYARLYREHWWWRARERVILQTLRAHVPCSSGTDILDVGCGDGLLFDALAEFGTAWGVESEAGLVSASGPHRDRITIAPFGPGVQAGRSFARLLMFDVLEHMHDPALALRHALSLLEPGGLVYITVPAFQVLWTGHDDVNHHVARYTRSTFGALAEEAGLHIYYQRYFFHWLFPAKLVARLGEMIVRRPPSPARVPSPLMNRACLGLSLLEARLFARAQLPFGSSLLVVAGAQEQLSRGAHA